MFPFGLYTHFIYPAITCRVHVEKQWMDNSPAIN